MRDEQITITVWNRLKLITKNGSDSKIRELTLITHFIIWRERCNWIFREKSKQNETLIQEIITQWRATTAENQDRNNIQGEVKF